MTLENIQTGKITEQELVELFGSDAQKKSYAENGKFVSKYKTSIFKKINRYCKIKECKQKQNGRHMYNITQVYDCPLPSNFNKMNKSIYKYIIPLILNKLINGHDKNNSIDITVGKWAREIKMINHNYNLIKNNRKDSSDEFQIDLNVINEFFDKADHMINWYIENALDYLKSAGLIIWREVNRVNVEETDGKSIIDQNGNVSVNVNITSHQASEAEMKYYSQCLAIADKEANIENASERYYSSKSKRFQEILKRELYKKNIKCVYTTYEAYYVHLDKCQSLLDKFGKFNQENLIRNFNEDFSNMLVENAGIRFDKNTIHYSLNKNDYLLSFEDLCEITIDNDTEYLGNRIREKNIEDDYNLKIVQRREFK